MRMWRHVCIFPVEVEESVNCAHRQQDRAMLYYLLFFIRHTFYIFHKWGLTEPHWGLPMSYPITSHSPDDTQMLQLLTFRFHDISMINLQHNSWNQMLCAAVAWCLVLSEGFGSRNKKKLHPTLIPSLSCSLPPPPPPHPRPRARTTGYAQRGAGAHPATNIHTHSFVSSSLFDYNILSFNFPATL